MTVVIIVEVAEEIEKTTPRIRIRRTKSLRISLSLTDS